MELVLDFARSTPAGPEVHRHHQPRLLVRAVPALGLRFRLAVGAAVFPLRAGRSRRAGDRGAPVQVEFRPSISAGVGSRRLAVFDVLEEGEAGRAVLSRHASARRARTSGFPPRPMVTGVRGRYMPEAALICNFPGGQTGRSGPSAVQRRGDVLPRIRTPDARDSWGPDRVGRRFRIRHRRRLHRSSLADA